MESRKLVLMNLFAKAAVEMQTQKTDCGHGEVGMGGHGMNGEELIWKYILPYVK